jgi:hypothetical protein
MIIGLFLGIFEVTSKMVHGDRSRNEFRGAIYRAPLTTTHYALSTAAVRRLPTNFLGAQAARLPGLPKCGLTARVPSTTHYPLITIHYLPNNFDYEVTSKMVHGDRSRNEFRGAIYRAPLPTTHYPLRTIHCRRAAASQ